jgi:hypothetical protein
MEFETYSDREIDSKSIASESSEPNSKIDIENQSEQSEEESFDNESDDDFDDFTDINIIDGMFKISFNIYIIKILNFL